MGARKHIDWAAWDSGPALCVASWCESRLLDIEFIAAHFDIGRGIQARLLEIEDAIPYTWQGILRGDNTLPEHVGWWGFFSSQGAPLLTIHMDMLFFVALE